MILSSQSPILNFHRVISQEAAKFIPEYRSPIVHSGIAMFRPQDIVYKKNELFIEVVERVNCLISPAGEVLQQSISGVLLLNSRLSGVPEVTMGFSNIKFPNDYLTFDPDFSTNVVRAYHSVRFRGDPSRIVFIPPDGEFELLHYSFQKDVRFS